MRARLSFCTAALVLCVSPVRAEELVSRPDFALASNGWAQAGYSLVEGPAPQAGTYLGLARLSATASHVSAGRAFVQIAGESGELALLDLVAEVTPIDGWALRVGILRVPLSLDWQVLAPQTTFVNRSFLASGPLIHRRLAGAETSLGRGLLPEALSVQIGVFNPPEDELYPLPGEGQLLSGRVLVQPIDGVSLHAAYLHLVGGDNAVAMPPDPPGGAARRPVPFDRQLDVGASYMAGGWTAMAEGLVVFESAAARTPFATFAKLARVFHLADERALEPGARYDFQRALGVDRHRATAGVTYYFVGDFLNTSLNYELGWGDGDAASAGFLQAQAGF